jgi:hypothetical protein
MTDTYAQHYKARNWHITDDEQSMYARDEAHADLMDELTNVSQMSVGGRGRLHEDLPSADADGLIAVLNELRRIDLRKPVTRTGRWIRVPINRSH